MGAGEPIRPDSLAPESIAPCGIDCGVCIAHLRPRNRCAGCNADEASKVHHCAVCRIKNCDELVAGERSFCFECPTYPCARLRQLDKRYRARYHMSVIENLDRIREAGLDAFVEAERVRWECVGCGALTSVHRTECPVCGRPAVREGEY
jgi:hypothetical protein